MTTIEYMQETIDKTEYWDLNILDFQTNFFGDEVNIFVYNDANTCWRISFLSCYKVTYETDATWRTITYVRDMKKPQLGYYGQDITLRESEEFHGFCEASIDLTLLTAKIICKEVRVENIFNNSLNMFWEDR